MRRPIDFIMKIALLCNFIALSWTMDNLKVAYEWHQIDFVFPSDQAREEAIENKEFIPENNIPVGLEVFNSRLFITIPRLKPGVPASLAYILLNNTANHTPKLIPYPNWSAHKFVGENVPELVSPHRIRADHCGRLWVLDSGVSGLRENFTVISPPQIVVYNLRNDQLLRRHVFPSSLISNNTLFANIAIEDNNCEDTYAYAGDFRTPSLLVYSWNQDLSWKVNHHFFHPDPVAGEFNVTGTEFQWADGLYGLGLSASDSKGFSTLYFHPLSSTSEFSVSTKILRNPTTANSYNDYKYLGSRGPNAQASVEFVDKSTGVLFYALVNLNAVACWKTTNKAYTIESQGRIFMSNVSMVYPNDIKVDDKGNLWVLSNRLPIFMYSKFTPTDFNFRILTATVKDAITGTACDSEPNIDLVKTFVDTNIKKINKTLFHNSSKSNNPKLQLIIISITIVLMYFNIGTYKL